MPLQIHTVSFVFFFTSLTAWEDDNVSKMCNLFLISKYQHHSKLGATSVGLDSNTSGFDASGSKISLV